MRELKFRAWGKNIKEYLSQDGVEPYAYTLKDISDGLIYGIDGFIIEQYTGFKDKNGKEIYEGDIVKLTGKVAQNKSTIYKVVWDSFVTGYDLISLEPSKSDVGYLNKTEIKNRYEVIGNIHDNPELLKKEK